MNVQNYGTYDTRDILQRKCERNETHLRWRKGFPRDQFHAPKRRDGYIELIRAIDFQIYITR